MKPRAGPAASNLGHFVVFLAAFAAIEVVLLATTMPQGLRGHLIDPDSFTRLLRVQNLIATGDWFGTVEPSLNAPYGLSTHWTRPVDALLVLGALPLAAFLGWGSALYWAGYLLSPLLAVAGFLCFAWAVSPLVGRGMRPLAMVALLAQPGFLNYGLPGRVDHHMLLLLAFILALGFGVRLFKDASSPRTARLLGVTLGVGMWLSVEFLITATLVGAVIWGFWVTQGGLWAQLGQRVFAAAATAALVALVLERGPGALTVEYDRFSIVHLSVTLAGMLVFTAMRLSGAGPRIRRPLLGLVAASVAFGVLVIFFPGLVVDPLRQGDPLVWARYYAKLEELQPLRPGVVGWGPFVGYLGTAALAVPFVCWRTRLVPAGQAWMWIAAILIPYLLLGVRQIRFIPYAAVLLAVGMTGLLRVILDRIDVSSSGIRRSAGRALASAFLLGGPLFLGGLVRGLEAGREPPAPVAADARFAPCSLSSLVAFLRDREGFATAPAVVLALPDIGPELAYRTPHRYVAAPYHRMEDGIRAALLLAEDEDEVRAVVEERGVSHVLLCPAWDAVLFSTANGVGFYDRLIDGYVPQWLRVVPLPNDVGGFRMYATRDAPS